MISAITVSILWIISFRILEKAAISFFFLSSCLLFVAFPFYAYPELGLEADAMAALSIFIVSVLSMGKLKASVNSAPPGGYRRRPGILQISLIVCILLFLLPIILLGKPPPIYLMLVGDFKEASHLREVFTKQSNIGILIDLVGKLGFSIPAYFIGLTLQEFTKKKRTQLIALLILSAAISLTYFQKSLPMQIILMVYLGQIVSGQFNFKKILVLAVISFVALALIGSVYVSTFSDSITVVLDLIFRRIGSVPALVYDGYISYGQQYGPLLLSNSLILDKGGTNLPLPIIIYHYLQYGSSRTGWANGLYVGDLYVNFGYAGVVFGSVGLGLLFRWGNNLARVKNYGYSRQLMILSLALVAFFVTSNALFAFSIIIVILSTFNIELLRKSSQANRPVIPPKIDRPVGAARIDNMQPPTTSGARH